MKGLTMSNIKEFQDLIAWQKAYDLCLSTYKLTDKFPKHELFGLTQHLRKTAISQTLLSPSWGFKLTLSFLTYPLFVKFNL